MLGSLLLNVNDNSSRKMSQSNCTVCSVDMLTTSPRGRWAGRQYYDMATNHTVPYPDAFNVSILRSAALILTST